MKLTVIKSKRGPVLHYYADRCGSAKRILEQNKEEIVVCDWCERTRRQSYEEVCEMN